MYYILNNDSTYRKAKDTNEFYEQFENMDRNFGNTEVNGVKISTVWLGIDHNHFNFSGAKPLLFGTTVTRGNEKCTHMILYSDWEDATKGHADAIRNSQSFFNP